MTTINTIEDLIRLLDENPEWLEVLRARLLTRELIDLPEKFAAFVESTNNRFEALQKEMHDGFQSIQNDLGPLKAAHARNSAIREAAAISDGLGLNRVRNLTYDDLRGMTLSSDNSDIPSNEIMSFRRADLVMEATDPSGETCYITVEISYTVNGRDTDRAVRNARLLTRLNRPSHPCRRSRSTQG